MKTWTLYGLRSRGTDEIRYIGITSRPLQLRLYHHLRPEQRKINPHKAAWIDNLRRAGLIPTIIPYAVGLTQVEASDLEIFVIASLREQGFKLTNIANGGNAGMAGRKHSLESKALMCQRHRALGRQGERNSFFGKKHSAESRRKMSAALSGENHRLWGKEQPIETRNKIGLANRNRLRGRKLSLETRLKISQSNRGRRHSPESNAKRSASVKCWWAAKKALQIPGPALNCPP